MTRKQSTIKRNKKEYENISQSIRNESIDCYVHINNNTNMLKRKGNYPGIINPAVIPRK